MIDELDNRVGFIPPSSPFVEEIAGGESQEGKPLSRTAPTRSPTVLQRIQICWKPLTPVCGTILDHTASGEIFLNAHTHAHTRAEDKLAVIAEDEFSKSLPRWGGKKRP